MDTSPSSPECFCSNASIIELNFMMSSGVEIHIDSTTLPYPLAHDLEEHKKICFYQFMWRWKLRAEFSTKNRKKIKDLCLQHARVREPSKVKACLSRYGSEIQGFEFVSSLWNIQMKFISFFHMFRLFCVI